MLQRFKHLVRDQPVMRAGALRAGAMMRGLAQAQPGVYTLCYHHVAPASQARFSAQIGYLKRFGEFVDADTAAERILSGRAAETRSFLLSFDDGYADNVDVALPVIRDHAVPAILFLVSDWLAAPPGPLMGQAGYMGPRDVETWLAAGLQIGSHSASHRRFSSLSRDEAASELTRSSTRLSEFIGRPPRHFACPWGVAHADYLPDRDPALAQASGYQTFFTTRRGKACAGTDLLAMPRHVLEPHWATYQLDALMGGRRYGQA